MRLGTVFVVVFLLAAACASTDENSSVEPIAPGPASSIVSGDMSRDIEGLQSIADDARRALIYVSDAQGVSAVAAGEGSNGSPIESDDAFFLGSASKMITAVAILQLVD